MCARQWALPTLDHGARSSPTPPHSGSQGPSAWVMRWCERLAPGSEVLDLACGSGRHSRVLAALGCRVDAVDVDAARAADLDGIPGVQFRALDLERGPWPFQAQRYDAVVVANYLYRPMLPLLAQALRRCCMCWRSRMELSSGPLLPGCSGCVRFEPNPRAWSGSCCRNPGNTRVKFGRFECREHP